MCLCVYGHTCIYANHNNAVRRKLEGVLVTTMQQTRTQRMIEIRIATKTIYNYKAAMRNVKFECNKTKHWHKRDTKALWRPTISVLKYTCVVGVCIRSCNFLNVPYRVNIYKHESIKDLICSGLSSHTHIHISWAWNHHKEVETKPTGVLRMRSFTTPTLHPVITYENAKKMWIRKLLCNSYWTYK